MTSAADLRSGLQRARALSQLHRYAEAGTLLGQVIASDPDNVEAWTLLAHARLGARDDNGALEAATRAASLAPEREWPHRLRAHALRHLGRRGEAVAAARAAVSCAPHTWQTHVTLAGALLDVDHGAERARPVVDRALALAPLEPDVHVVDGAVKAAAGHRLDAAEAYRRALELDPDHAAAHNELARLSLERRKLFDPGGLAKAASGFATALRSDPRADVSRSNLELVVRVFLARAAYLLFLEAYVVARLGGHVNLGGLLLVLGLPAAFVARFVSRLPPHLRRYLRDTITTRRALTVAVGLDVAAVGCLVAGALAPRTAAQVLAATAAVTGLAARIVLHRDLQRWRARRVRWWWRISAGSLHVLGVVLAVLTLLMVASISDPAARWPSLVLAVLSGAGCGVCVYGLRRRRTDARP